MPVIFHWLNVVNQVLIHHKTHVFRRPATIPIWTAEPESRAWQVKLLQHQKRAGDFAASALEKWKLVKNILQCGDRSLGFFSNPDWRNETENRSRRHGRKAWLTQNSCLKQPLHLLIDNYLAKSSSCQDNDRPVLVISFINRYFSDGLHTFSSRFSLSPYCRQSRGHFPSLNYFFPWGVLCDENWVMFCVSDF